MSDRAKLADSFLAGTGWGGAQRRALAGDASARRYWRLLRPDGQTAVLMDAPSDQGSGVEAFVDIARHLTEAGFSAPGILRADAAAGFILMEDLGDAVFARMIAADPGTEQPLYEAAVDLLVALQRRAPAAGLAVFTPAILAEQTAPVFDWYLRGISGTIAPDRRSGFLAMLETVLTRSLFTAQVMILRDYHAENLIWLPDRKGIARVGVLDFQDALIGDPAYDLVSLLQDARRDLSPGIEARMIARFADATGHDPDRFFAAYAASGAQRHLRILGIFARLSLHFGKPQYIDLIPRVWGHLMDCLDHPALAPVAARVCADLPPPSPETLDLLRQRCATVPTP